MRVYRYSDGRLLLFYGPENLCPMIPMEDKSLSMRYLLLYNRW